jgi:hypothetical protein
VGFQEAEAAADGECEGWWRSEKRCEVGDEGRAEGETAAWVGCRC